jgi:hypothetical protein
MRTTAGTHLSHQKGDRVSGVFCEVSGAVPDLGLNIGS